MKRDRVLPLFADGALRKVSSHVKGKCRKNPLTQILCQGSCVKTLICILCCSRLRCPRWSNEPGSALDIPSSSIPHSYRQSFARKSIHPDTANSRSRTLDDLCTLAAEEAPPFTRDKGLHRCHWAFYHNSRLSYTVADLDGRCPARRVLFLSPQPRHKVS